MPVDALNAQPGDPAANSYCTVDEADQYAADNPWASAWASYTADQKTQALLLATELIDERFVFIGRSTSVHQKLAWPRWGTRFVTGYIIPSNVIPDALKKATAEYARQLLVSNRTADNDVETQGIKMIGVGSTQVVFTGNTVAKPVPDAVTSKLAAWGTLRIGRGSVSLIRA